MPHKVVFFLLLLSQNNEIFLLNHSQLRRPTGFHIFSPSDARGSLMRFPNMAMLSSVFWNGAQLEHGALAFADVWSDKQVKTEAVNSHDSHLF